MTVGAIQEAVQVALVEAMTNFEIAVNALNQMNVENAVAFKEEMKKVGDVFTGIKNECTEEQLKQLSDSLESASGCVDGLASDIDESGFLGFNDDELFAMFFFQNILKQFA